MNSSQIREARRLWSEGLRMTDIAMELDVPYSTMASFAWKHRDLFPWGGRHTEPRRSTPEQRDEMLRLHSEGVGITEIARLLGLTLSCVRYWIGKESRCATQP